MEFKGKISHYAFIAKLFLDSIFTDILVPRYIKY